MLVAIEGQVALSFPVFLPQDAVSRGELGHDEAASAEIADETAKDGIGDTGHGREHGGGGDIDVADADGSGHGHLYRTGTLIRDRIFPILTHLGLFYCLLRHLP